MGRTLPLDPVDPRRSRDPFTGDDVHDAGVLVFLTIVFAVYRTVGTRAQNYWLLAASLLFYGWWDWRFLGLLLFAAGIDFVVGLRLANETRERHRRILLSVSLVGNLGTLALFKYADFFIASCQASAATFGIHLDPFALRVVLPVGISLLHVPRPELHD